MRLSHQQRGLFLGAGWGGVRHSIFFSSSPSLPCVLLVAFCFHPPTPPPHPPLRRTGKGEPLRPGFSIHHLLIPPAPTQPPHPPPCYTIFILPHHVTPPSPPLSMPRPACVPRPCLSCSRFSFCWRVLIGLKWVTSSITQSFKPSLNVSVSWGSEGALWGCPPSRQPS